MKDLLGTYYSTYYEEMYYLFKTEKLSNDSFDLKVIFKKYFLPRNAANLMTVWRGADKKLL